MIYEFLEYRYCLTEVRNFKSEVRHSSTRVTVHLLQARISTVTGSRGAISLCLESEVTGAWILISFAWGKNEEETRLAREFLTRIFRDMRMKSYSTLRQILISRRTRVPFVPLRYFVSSGFARRTMPRRNGRDFTLDESRFYCRIRSIRIEYFKSFRWHHVWNIIKNIKCKTPCIYKYTFVVKWSILFIQRLNALWNMFSATRWRTSVKSSDLRKLR